MNTTEPTGLLVSQAAGTAKWSTPTPVQAIEIVPGEGVRTVEHAHPGMKPYEVEIAPLYSFISAGTELHVLRELMGCSSTSRSNARMGYSQCGVIQRVGASVQGLRKGQRVVAIGEGAYHATRTVVSRNLVVPVPDDVDPKGAALAAMFCFALEGVQKSKVRLGENVVVFGAGMMGQLAVRLYELSGSRTCVMDSNAHRLRFLPPGTATFPLDDAGWAALAHWAKPHGIEHASICFGGDATQAIEKLKPLMTYAPDGVPHGRIVFPGGARLSVLMASNMGNIELLSSAKAGPGYRDPVYESGVPYPAAYVAHPVQRNMQTMLQLMQRGKLDLLPLITHVFAFSQAEAAYTMLLQPNVEALAVLLDYQTPGSI